MSSLYVAELQLAHDVFNDEYTKVINNRTKEEASQKAGILYHFYIFVLSPILHPNGGPYPGHGTKNVAELQLAHDVFNDEYTKVINNRTKEEASQKAGILYHFYIAGI